MTNLSSYLTASNVTQAQLANMVSVSRGYMSELVNGSKTPGLRVALAIEKATRGKVKANSWAKAEMQTQQGAA